MLICIKFLTEILRASEEKLCDLNKNVVTGSHVLRKKSKRQEKKGRRKWSDLPPVGGHKSILPRSTGVFGMFVIMWKRR